MIAHNMETVEEITETGTALTDRIIREYMEGASVWKLKMRYAHLLTHAGVRRLLEGVVRPSPSDQSPSDPTPEEIAAERDRLKSQWSAETASRRWVGRYLSRPETLGEALSKQLNAIDRRYR